MRFCCQHYNLIAAAIYRATTSFLLCCAVALMFGCAKPAVISQQDAAPKHIPKHLDRIPDPVPKVEPLSRYGNRFKNSNSYVALKKRYTVMPTSRGYRAQGQASWYGTKFHGKRTSSGEPYDMFSMTAAHRTLPLPTYARVTNLDNGKTVIVKINDRGPFHNNRLIDLSYVAAHKLGILGKGTGRVAVESIDPRDHHGKIPGQKRNFFAQNKTVKRPQHVFNAHNAELAHNTNAAHHAELAHHTNAAHHVALAQNTGSAYHSELTQNTDSVHHSGLAHKTTSGAKQQKLYLQVGAFTQKSHAENMLNEVSKLSKYSASIATQKQNKKSLFKVRLGPFDNQRQLLQATKALAKANLPTPVAIKE